MLLKRAAWLLVLVVVPFSQVTVSVTFARIWKSSNGAYSIDAEFVESKDGTVSLRKSNGDTITVSVSRLSVEDQAYVTEQAASNGVSSAKADPSSSPAVVRTFTQLVQSANRLRKASLGGTREETNGTDRHALAYTCRSERQQTSSSATARRSCATDRSRPIQGGD